jgi:cell division initiation protein
MKITPLDITQKTFRSVWRGCDPGEVQSFLELVAGELEGVAKEVQSLREDARRLDDEIAELRGRERLLQETMVSAQKASADLKEAARKESEILLSQAELEAEKIVQGAHARYLKIVDDIQELKRQRAQFEAQVRAVLHGHEQLLEAMKDVAPEGQVEYLASKK